MANNRHLLLGLLLMGAACRSNGDGAKPAGAATPDAQTKAQKPTAESAVSASVGRPAPDFTLPDLDGKPVHLADFRGKIVVLEWFNPECPFVKASHTQGSLVRSPGAHLAEGTVWLAVNSGAPGKQGAGAEKSRAGREKFALSYPILIDETGAVGRLYGAERTPHMYVIDPQGVLVYRGAIDNSPDAIGESPTDGKLVNYVDEAVQAVRHGKAPAVAETKAYGCGVKYAN